MFAGRSGRRFLLITPPPRQSESGPTASAPLLVDLPLQIVGGLLRLIVFGSELRGRLFLGRYVRLQVGDQHLRPFRTSHGCCTVDIRLRQLAERAIGQGNRDIRPLIGLISAFFGPFSAGHES